MTDARARHIQQARLSLEEYMVMIGNAQRFLKFVLKRSGKHLDRETRTVLIETVEEIDNVLVVPRILLTETQAA